jgi:hypothetical protein
MRDPQNRPLLYAAIVLCLSGQFAYAENEEIIATCARIATVGDRILCLEDALRRSPPATGSAPVESDTRPIVATEHAAAAATVHVPAAPAATVAPTEHSPAASAAPAEPPAPAVQPATTVIISAADTPSDTVEGASRPDSNFGLKQVREVNTIQVTVTSVRKNLTNKLVFETEDGQIWIQTDQRNVRYEDAPFIARIRSASMGSFFLKPESSGVSVRVRREK